MQAIEINTEITTDGHICLPPPLQNLYGRLARLILLFEENSPAVVVSSIDKIQNLRGSLHNNTDFDTAMQEMEQAWQARQS